MLQEDLEQLYDDQFIETCADWVVALYRRPDRLPHAARRHRQGRQPARRGRAHDRLSPAQGHGVGAGAAGARRHRLGRDARSSSSSGWSMTQYMNHLRPQCRGCARPAARGSRWSGSAPPSTRIMRTIDVRRIASGRGRYNIPNVGVFLWRLDACPLTRLAGGADRRAALALPSARHRPAALHAAADRGPRSRSSPTPLNVPAPISRRVLAARLADYYTGADGVTKSLRLYENSSGSFMPIDPAAIADLQSRRRRRRLGAYAGRRHATRSIRCSAASRCPRTRRRGPQCEVDFHYGFSADIGGGEYERAAVARERADAAAAAAGAGRPSDHPGRARARSPAPAWWRSPTAAATRKR